MDVACIILNYNDAENTIGLLKEIKDFSALQHIIIVDNCSTDDSFKYLKKYENNKIHVHRTQENGGYGAGNNYGVRCASYYGCKYALIANPDVLFSNHLVCTLVDFLESHSMYGVVSGIQRDGKNVEPKRTAWKIPSIWQYIFSIEIFLRCIGKNFYYSYEELKKNRVITVECVAGSLLMVSISKFMKCGGYDEDMFLYCEETTLGIKMRELSYKTAIISNVFYCHIHGASIQKSISSNLKKKKILLQSHRIVLKRYMKANRLELLVDWIVGKVVLFEEILKSSIRTR